MKISNLKDTPYLLEIIFVALSEVCVCPEFNLLFFFLGREAHRSGLGV